MDDQVRLPNPIWWVQSRLAGWRKMAIIALAYAFSLLLLVQLVRWSDPGLKWTDVASVLLKILAAIQSVLMLLGGSAAVFKTLERDYTTKMLESHRLSPMSSLAVTVGYVFGATVQVILLWLVGLLLGAVLVLVAGWPVAPWLVGNALLLSTAAMVWSFTVFLGVGGTKPLNPVGLIVIGGFVGMLLVMALPGLGLISGGYAAFTAWKAMTGSFQLTPPASAVTASADVTPLVVALLVAANAVMMGLWFSAARQRYRRPDRPGFTVPRALILLILWALAGAVGIRLFASVAPGDQVDQHPEHLQFVATLVLSLIWSILPVSAACIDRARLIKGATPRTRSERVPSRLVVLAAVIGVCAVMSLVDIRWETAIGTEFVSRLSSETWLSWLWTSLAIGIGLLAVDGFFRIMYLARRRAAAAATWFLFLLWLMPPAVDYLIYLLRSPDVAEAFDVLDPTVLFACSPLGTLVGAWDLADLPTVALAGGLTAQATMAAVMILLAARAERREIARRRADGLELPGLSGPPVAG